MAFAKKINITIIKNTPAGVFLGEEAQEVIASFKVKVVNISEEPAFADLYVNYGDGDWKFHQSYNFSPDYSSGIDALMQAENAVRLLDEYADAISE